MRAKLMGFTVAGLTILASGGYGLYHLGMDQGMRMASPANDSAAEGRRVLYWHDPMVPGQKFDKAGKSPFMDMQLVPVYADEAGGEGSVKIDPRIQQNLGVRTATAKLASLTPKIDAVGNVVYNERDVALVQARGNGFIERLHVRAALDPVRKGQPLADVYVPDWVAAQEEFLTARGMGVDAPAELLEGARQRMRLAGMTEDQIRLVEREGKVHPRVTISAPIDGVVSELSAREGMTVMNGAPLFRINGLGTVWVNAEIPESEAHVARPGAAADVTTAAFPDETFNGRVTAILPEVNAATRTLKARVEVVNKGAKLVPGMFARVVLSGPKQADVIVVPSEAVIRTGKRNVVMLARAEGQFTPVEVEVGKDSSGMTQIRSGIAAGDKVVTSGQFLVDSEASLKGVEARTQGGGADKAASTTGMPVAHRGEGRVERVEGGEITLSHGPIPSLNWPSMTMAFKAPPGGMPMGIKKGDEVTFETRQLPDGPFEIVSIARKPGATK